MWYPLTCDCQCFRCGGHHNPDHVGIVEVSLGSMNHGRTWACECPQVKPRGKSTGRTPTTRQVLSECHVGRGWTVVWRGTEGSCLAVGLRLRRGFYRPDLLDKIEVINAFNPPAEYIVLARKKREAPECH